MPPRPSRLPASALVLPDRRRTVLLAVALLLVSLLPLAVASPAQAAFVDVIDPGGVDDVNPAALDLTTYGIDTVAGEVRFSFDATTGTGNSSHDGCILVDSDNDTNADAALCVTLTPAAGPGAQPLQLDAVRLITCNDSSPDRCSRQTVTDLPLGTCTVAQTPTDPFKAEEDTRVVCTVVPADFPGASPAFSAICAYPSQQPNSAPFDCFDIPRATLVIAKTATPNSGLFPFTLSSAALPATTVFTAAGTATSAGIPIPAGQSHALLEVLPGGWTLDSAFCLAAPGGASVGTPGGLGVTGIVAGVGETITCQFANSAIPAGGVTVTKTPDRTTVPEPGGPVTYTVTLENTSTTTPADVTALVDVPFGDLTALSNTTGAPMCTMPQTLAIADNTPGSGPDFYTCAFTAPVTGDGGDVHANTVTATVGNAAPSASASVTITDVQPTLTVDKSAVPATVVTSAPVVFTVSVGNPSLEDVTGITLVDDIYGNLDGRGTCVSPVSIPAGGMYTCSFTETLTQPAGTTHVNTVTATGQDDEGNSATAMDAATVTFVAPGFTPTAPTADVSIVKTVLPIEVGVGQTAVFALLVSNAGPGTAQDVTVTDVMPDGLDITDVSTSQGTCTVTGQSVACDLGNMPAGTSATVSIEVIATGTGEFENAAAVDSPTFDPDGTDDADSVTLPVVELDPAQICEPFLEGHSRIDGPTRIETAIAGSQTIFCDQEATAVVLTRSDEFPDAQAGTPLAIHRDAPLLLSEPDALNPLTEEEILRVLQPGGTVYLLGGTVALSQAVEDRITQLGFEAVRYGGENRFGTAAIIADQGLDNPLVALVADGQDFPDSVIAGSASLVAGGGIGQAAVLLTAGDQIPPETQGYLDGRVNPPTLFAIGAPARAAFPDVMGYGDDDRYATSVAVAERFFTMPRIVGIATGADFADALTGGAVVGRPDAGPGPMLLVDGDVLPQVTADYLEMNRDSIVAAIVFGGTAAISDQVQDDVVSYLMHR